MGTRQIKRRIESLKGGGRQKVRGSKKVREKNLSKEKKRVKE